MRAAVGDWLRLGGRDAGQPHPPGQIIEIHGAHGEPPYLVRFRDGHTSLVIPGPEAVITHSAPDEPATAPRLIFRVTASQRRALVITAAVSTVLAAVLAWVGLAARNESFLAVLAAGVGIVALAAVYYAVAYATAYTECTPAGLRTRGVTWRRLLAWERLRDIAVRDSGSARYQYRYPTRAKPLRIVIITADDGTRFWLGAPIDGAQGLGDPEFEDKIGQIRHYWHVVVTSPTDITSPRDITPAPLPAGLLTANLPGPTGPRVEPPAAWPAPARRRRPGMRALDLVSTACFVLAGLVAAAMLVAAPFALGPAFRAAHGTGTPGVFTAQEQHCTRVGCIWDGTFRSDHGTVLQADYGDAAPPGTHPGSSFPALWPGGSNDVYAAHGSTGWVQIVLLEAVVLAVLAALLWYGPIRYIRKRGWHARRVHP